MRVLYRQRLRLRTRKRCSISLRSRSPAHPMSKITSATHRRLFAGSTLVDWKIPRVRATNLEKNLAGSVWSQGSIARTKLRKAFHVKSTPQNLVDMEGGPGRVRCRTGRPVSRRAFSGPTTEK